MRRVLLLGYFGAGNFGDDALLADWLGAEQQWLAQNELRADVIYNGREPLAEFVEEDKLRPLIGELIPKRQALRIPLDGYEALIAPGGSLLQDATSVRSVLYYLAVIRRFHRADIPVYLLNQGIGPLSSWLASFLTPRYLARTRLLTFRDRDSFRWAEKQRVLSRHSQMLLSADPILAGRLAKLPESATGLPAGEYTLVLPRATGDLPTAGDPTPEPEALARLLSHTSAVTELPVVLASLHRGRDELFCQDVAQYCQPAQVLALAGAEHRASLIWTLISRAKLVISYRLHGLVVAAAHRCPALGVAYDPKVTSFCEEAGYPYTFPATLHQQTAMEDIQRLWTEREAVREHALQQREQMLGRLKQAQERFHELW